MSAVHDIYQDLNISKDEMQKKRAQEPKLDQLMNDYHALDDEIVAAESDSEADFNDDDAMRELKAKRLALKDSIAQQVQSS